MVFSYIILEFLFRFLSHTAIQLMDELGCIPAGSKQYRIRSVWKMRQATLKGKKIILKTKRKIEEHWRANHGYFRNGRGHAPICMIPHVSLVLCKKNHSPMIYRTTLLAIPLPDIFFVFYSLYFATLKPTVTKFYASLFPRLGRARFKRTLAINF